MEAFISEEQAKEVCKEIFIKWPYNESSWIEIEEDVADE
jgi:hypothetical protein